MSDAKKTIAIGIDLGGTNLKIAAVDRRGRVLASLVEPLPGEPGPAPTISAMARGAMRLADECGCDRAQVVGIGLGTPGPLDLTHGVIVEAANIPGWKNVPVRDELSRSLGLPVVFDNDANAAAFGEYWVGAGRDGGDMVMLTLGTGVGGGVILDGRILHGHFDNAGELGHMIVEPRGLPCPCGQHGCLEQYSSASGVARRAKAAVDAGKPTSLAARLGDGGTIDATDVALCAMDGDEVAGHVWDEACFYLAVAAVNIQHAFNPYRLVLGGGMADAGATLVDRVVRHVKRLAWSLADDAPTVVCAGLGYDAGVIGAAGLAWDCRGL